MRYAVMLKCDAGTMRLVEDGRGIGWQRNYHWIVWVVEDSEERAEEALRTITYSRWVVGKKVVPHPIDPDQYYV